MTPAVKGRWQVNTEDDGAGPLDDAEAEWVAEGTGGLMVTKEVALVDLLKPSRRRKSGMNSK